MRHLAAILTTGFLGLAGFAAGPAGAVDVFDNFGFTMVPTNGDEACIPKAAGNVTISPLFGQTENMLVEVTGLPPNTDFDLFVIQVPTPKFGLAWYMGDLLTDFERYGRTRLYRALQHRHLHRRAGIGAGAGRPKQTAVSRPAHQPSDWTGQLYHLGLSFELAQGCRQGRVRHHRDAVQFDAQRRRPGAEHEQFSAKGRTPVPRCRSLRACRRSCTGSSCLLTARCAGRRSPRRRRRVAICPRTK